MQSGLEQQDIRRELDRVLASRDFANNERQSRFLRFLVERHLEGRDSELKESVIAVEVFGRDAGYDPKVDAIVRTEAVRLRARLDKYYSAEGAQNPLVIELPKGGYKPVVRQRTIASVPPGSAAARSRLLRIPWLVAGLVLVAVVATAAWWTSRSTVQVSVAVRPFENVSKNPETDYFADGLTDEIIRNLSVIESLRVPSRTSAFALKDKALSATDAGRLLGADYLVEGSVLQTGHQLRVNVALVRVRDDTRIWSDRFDRELTDVFAIQDEISRGVVNSLRLRLEPGRRRYETNLEAYDLYLRGRHVMEGFPSRVRPVAQMARQYFEQAIEKDANYAIAYAGLADVLLAIDENAPVARDAFARAKTAAEKAVQLDPLLSEAHRSMGVAHAREYAWDDAERALRRAIDLNRNNALARQALGLSVLIPLGRVEEGLEEVRRAAALDPLSAYMSTQYGEALRRTGQYADASVQFQKAIALDPTRNQPYNFLGRALYLQGKPVEALAVFDESIKRGMPPERMPWRVCALQRAGQQAAAAELYAARATTAMFVSESALWHACMGETEHALASLEAAFADHEPRLVAMLDSPELAPLRADPRYAALRRKANLPR